MAFTELDLSKVRTRLLLRHPFFGSLAMRLKYRADAGIPTLCTDGESMLYNPDFMSRLSDTGRQAVLVHEISHCALLHMFRRGSRDMRQWNVACDYAINPMVEEAGLTLPREIKNDAGQVIFKGPLLDPKYAGMSAEAIYAKLQQEQQKEKEKSDGSGNGSGSGGEGAGSDQGSDRDGDNTGKDQKSDGKSENPGGTDGGGEQGASGGSESSAGGGPPSVTGDFVDGKTDAEGGAPGDMNETDWKLAVQQAVNVARMAGKLPGGWAEEIAAAREPKMDPWAIIEQYVARTVQSDFSWSAPNRRLLSQGLYMPGPIKENMGEIVIGIDTSGSMSKEMLEDCAAHVIGIAKTYLPEKIHVVFADTQVTNFATYESADYDNITFLCKGRGGTSLSPVFDWVEAQGIKPEVLIFFTDLYAAEPPTPDYDVVWAVPAYLERQKGWFGATVHIDCA